jgi:hypothetical protein
LGIQTYQVLLRWPEIRTDSDPTIAWHLLYRRSRNDHRMTETIHAAERFGVRRPIGLAGAGGGASVCCHLLATM